MNLSTDIFIPPIVPEKTAAVYLRFEFDDKSEELTADEFWEFCSQNDKLQIELFEKNKIKITFPRGFSFSQRSLEILLQLGKWEENFKAGIVFNDLVGYLLPDGHIFSPSFSWIKKERFEDLSNEQKERLIHICPDFVIELRSESDNLNDLKNKMEEYIENGARLGWLIDPKRKEVSVYRANGEIEVLENPESVSGEDILKEFVLDLKEIW